MNNIEYERVIAPGHIRLHAKIHGKIIGHSITFVLGKTAFLKSFTLIRKQEKTAWELV